MNMEPPLAGKYLLVTGAASGIGRETALTAARSGAAGVIVADRNVDGGRETARCIANIGGRASFLDADITRTGDVDALMDRALALCGRLDCAFNCAGILGPVGPLDRATEEDFRAVLETNVVGTWLCMKREIVVMTAQGSGGAIVNAASVYGLVGARQGFGPYIASKHAIVGLTRAAALEYARARIRVNAVCPSATPTAMTAPFLEASPQAAESFRARHPLGRMASVADIARAVVWLCSDASSFVTGHTLVVDGGMTVG